MKINFPHKKWLFSGVIVMITIFANNIFAQSLKRQCISSYGSSTLIDSISIGQTAGQSYNTGLSSDDKAAVSQGFQQPKTFYIEEVSSASLKNLKLLVFPNPASYSFTIKTDEKIERTFIQIVDVNGKNVFSENIENLLKYEIQCDSWVNGVYLITISDAEKNSKTLRLIISK